MCFKCLVNNKAYNKSQLKKKFKLQKSKIKTFNSKTEVNKYNNQFW